jgi:tripartite-type tricarboxylate transporter receptor subunit TctC
MHVPYKGGAAAMTDLRAGRIDILIDVMPALAGQVKAGTVRLLGVTSDKRVPSNPDVPTFQEAGVPNYSFVAWDGIFAPKGTPEAILEKANKAVQKIMAKPELQNALSSRGAIPSPTSRAELAKFVKEQYDMLGKVVKDAGITIN